MKNKESIIDYLTEELKINTDALAHYDKIAKDLLFKDAAPEVQRMREMESIMLRDRVSQISRHIAVAQLLE